MRVSSKGTTQNSFKSYNGTAYSMMDSLDDFKAGTANGNCTATLMMLKS